MNPRILTALLVAPALHAAQYHVDALNGCDSNSGLSPVTAWRTLERAGKTELAPGDALLLRRGQVFPGQLKLSASGTADAPVVVTGYGDGARPHISCGGSADVAILLDNVSHFTLEGIEASNTGPEPKAKRRGVLVRIRDCGVAENIVLRDLFVHDVNGVISKDEGGGTGIRWEVASTTTRSRISGLLIEGCHVLRCDRDGIKGWMDPWDDMSFLSTGVVIRGNLLEDIGGDGIVPIGTDGAVVEFNRIYGARQRFDPTVKEVSQYAGPSVGIWPWSSINTQVRFNEVWGYRGTFDGQGFDSDYNCDGTTFEYNLSGDNAGGFFLICNWAEHQDAGRSIGNSNTLIRHNISLNDHTRAFVLNGPVRGVRITGNIIYNTIEEELPLIMDTPWGRYSESVEVTGNLFFTSGVARVFQGTWAGDGLGNWKYQAPVNRASIRFENNAYSNVAGHDEPGMRALSEDESLASLIKRFDNDPAARAGFLQLIAFLRGSRHWPQVAGALHDSGSCFEIP
jgi:hypothetical protein